MSKTLGLALGSGGARGVAHIGFLQALEEEGIKPDYISGCSMGAVVGGCYASGMEISEMRELVLKIKKRDLIDLSAAPLSKMSLLRSKKIHELLVENCKVKNIEDFPIKFCCVSTDILTGSIHVFDSGNAAMAMQASSTIPGVFRPISYENELLVDGGCACRVPIRQVKDMGAEVVVAVDALKNCSKPVEKLENILALLLRVYDVMDARCSKFEREKNAEICDLYLEPELEGMSQYVIKNLSFAFEEGYALGKKNIERISKLIA